MPQRIRTIKPDFFTDQTIGGLSPRARIAYPFTWIIADDRGRIKDLNAATLRGSCFAYDDITLHESQMILDELVNADLLTRYQVGNDVFFWIRTFTKHQKINRPTASKIPPHPDDKSLDPGGQLEKTEKKSQTKTTAYNKLSEDSVRTHGGLSEDSVRTHGGLSEDSLRERKGKEGKGKSLTGIFPSPNARARKALGASGAACQDTKPQSTGQQGMEPQAAKGKFKELSEEEQREADEKMREVMATVRRPGTITRPNMRASEPEPPPMPDPLPNVELALVRFREFMQTQPPSRELSTLVPLGLEGDKLIVTSTDYGVRSRWFLENLTDLNDRIRRSGVFDVTRIECW